LDRALACFLDPFFPGSLPPVCVCALVHAHAPILPGLFLETLAKTLKKCRENYDETLSKKGKGHGETSGSLIYAAQTSPTSRAK
jgi:hypothetical protein